MEIKKFWLFILFTLLLFINLKTSVVYGTSTTLGSDKLDYALENLEENNEVSLDITENDTEDNEDFIDDMEDDTEDNENFIDDMEDDTEDNENFIDDIEDDAENDEVILDTIEDNDDSIPYAGFNNIMLILLFPLIIISSILWYKIRLMKNI